jgi:hypothetical protein
MTNPITPEVKLLLKAWASQPTAASIMAEAMARCRGLKSLKEICLENGLDYWPVKKYVYHTINK